MVRRASRNSRLSKRNGARRSMRAERRAQNIVRLAPEDQFAKAGYELAEQKAGYGAWFWHQPTNAFHMTPNARAVIGIGPDTATLETMLAAIHEEDRAEVEKRVEGHLNDGEPYDLACRIRRPDGETRWIRACGHVSEDKHANGYMVAGSIEDTTFQVETLNELQQSEMRFRSLIEKAPFPVVITRPSDRTIRFYNQAAETLIDSLGKLQDKMYLPDIVDDDEIYERIRDELLATGQTSDIELPLKPKSGEPTWVSVKGVLIDYLGEPAAYIILYDVTERHALEDKLRRQATSDPLTGVANRTELLQQLNQSIATSDRSGEGFALLLLDLDNFKMVNDTLGHTMGDKLLTIAADRLQHVLRVTDTVARIGGDEFAIIARHLDKVHGVSVLAQKIIDVLSQPFTIDGKISNVGCSIGVAHYPWDKGDPELLMQHADLALYRAKDEGRGRFHLFDEELSRAVHERMELDRDLREALVTDQFFVAYQPRFDAATRQPVASEALARWRHPDKGLVSPGAFIPMAEETGLVVELGRVVLDKVCCDIARWRSDALNVGPVSVNISPIHLAVGNVLEDVFAALKKYDLPAECLQVEVTESTMITDEESAVSQIKALANAGIMVLIDDFGTGYSSLSYLHRFAAHELKIDRSFVSNVMDPTSAILARQIVSIGKSLDLKIVAEGVETEEQADFMTAIGCDELQGFLLSKPIEADAFETLMKSVAPVPPMLSLAKH
jgi:diguanylate cyclase (GGDEF)-like protein/PAS domain S-box-containing protein